jgi:hypothetical protein
MDLGEATVKPPAELIRIKFRTGAPPPGDHDARSSYSREPGDTDQFPGHPHRCVGYGS